MDNNIERLESEIPNLTREKKIEALIEIAISHRTQHDLETAINYLKQAIQYFDESIPKSMRADVNYKLGIIYYYNSDYLNSQIFLLKTYYLLNKLTDDKSTKIRLNTLLAFGVTKLRQGQYTRSIFILHKALNIANQLESGIMKAKILNWQAICYTNLAKYKVALDKNLESLNYFRAIDNKEWISNLFNSIGLIYYYLNEDDKALNYMQQSLDVATEIEYNMGISNTLNNLGLLYNKKEKYQKSLDYYLRCIENRAKFVGKILLDKTYLNISKNYISLKNYDKAIEFAKKAFEIASKNNDEDNTFLALIYQALIYRDLKQFELALDYCNQALPNEEKFNSLLNHRGYYKCLSSIYEAMGNYKEALEAEKQKVAILDKIRDESIKEQTDIIEKLNTYRNRDQISEIHKEKNKELSLTNKILEDSLHKLDITNHILRHDIINNLAVVKSCVKMYNRTQNRDYIDSINSKTDESLNLIKSLANLPRTNSDSSNKLEIFKLEKVISQIMITRRKISYKINGAGLLKADKRLISVINNIIDNAIRHGKTKFLEFVINSDDNQIQLKIKDFGIGVDPAIAHKIFEKEFSYGSSGHTGLGLYICKEVIKSYQGQISFEPNEPNGSIFILTFSN